MPEEFLLKEIECDRYNIQSLIDRMPLATSKGEYRSIVANIKILVKTIHNTKCSIDDKMFYKVDKVMVPLFEVRASPLNIIDEYKEMDSFFGDIE